MTTARYSTCHSMDEVVGEIEYCTNCGWNLFQVILVPSQYNLAPTYKVLFVKPQAYAAVAENSVSAELRH